MAQSSLESKRERKERLFAGLVRDLRNQISLKGHPAFSASQISALLESGHCFEPSRIRYVRGPRRKCLEIAHRKLLKHNDWSLWMGFVLNRTPTVWSAHAWNRTPHGYLIEPNARSGQVELYYGFEVLVGSKTLARGGLSAEEIGKFDAYTLGFVTEQRKQERK